MFNNTFRIWMLFVLEWLFLLYYLVKSAFVTYLVNYLFADCMRIQTNIFSLSATEVRFSFSIIALINISLASIVFIPVWIWFGYNLFRKMVNTAQCLLGICYYFILINISKLFRWWFKWNKTAFQLYFIFNNSGLGGFDEKAAIVNLVGHAWQDLKTSSFFITISYI